MFRSLVAFIAVAAVGSAAATAAAPISKPDRVSAQCQQPANAWACAVALRYLAALDLDQTRTACSLLERETLEAAGGMESCRKTLARARGIRIRYSILEVRPSPFGRSVYFTTRADGHSDLRQAMIVTRRRRIMAIAPVPCSTC